MEIRQLTYEDKQLFMDFTQLIVFTLDHPNRLLPLSQEEADAIFVPGSEDYILGGFDEDGEMIATLSLLRDYNELLPYLPEHLLDKKGSEIGEAMVLPAFRRQGLMHELVDLIFQRILDEQLDYVVATAHPLNEGSNHLIQSAGFELITTIDRRGYERNLYLKDFTNHDIIESIL